MPKSTITITDEGGLITLTVAHDPQPEGPISTWHIPAKTAQIMARFITDGASNHGIEPVYLSVRNAETGHTKITIKEKDEDQPKSRLPLEE